MSVVVEKASDRSSDCLTIALTLEGQSGGTPWNSRGNLLGEVGADVGFLRVLATHFDMKSKEVGKLHSVSNSTMNTEVYSCWQNYQVHCFFLWWFTAIILKQFLVYKFFVQPNVQFLSSGALHTSLARTPPMSPSTKPKPKDFCHKTGLQKVMSSSPLVAFTHVQPCFSSEQYSMN